MIEAVESDRGIFRSSLLNSHHCIQLLTKLLSGFRATFTDCGREHDIAHSEIFAVRIPTNRKRRVLSAEEIRSARARHIRRDQISRQAFANTAFVKDD